jgi:hypothetical protein
MFTAKSRWISYCFAAAFLLLAPSILVAAERGLQTNGPYNPNHETVEMFKAMEDGQISVKFIPKDSKQANVLIENKTDKPLNVKLPDAFAGVPVLAQLGVGGGVGGNRGGSSSRNGGQNQSMGGGMGGMGMGGMGMGGMGMFNIAPEKVGQIKVDTVCLEHGKSEPRAAIPYEIKPIDSINAKAGVKELCQMLGSGKIDQRAAQAAAWHLNNEMSWQELAAKRLKHANGTYEPYFKPQVIRAAMELAGNAQKVAAEKEQQQPSTTGKENNETSTRQQ